MKTPLRSFLAPLLALLATALPAPAQITFTVTATADHAAGTAAEGYVADHAYTFVYVLTPAYPLNHNYFPGQNNGWFEKDITAEIPLFTAMGGTGLTGVFTDPSGPVASPFSFVRTDTADFLGLFAGADVGDIGLTTLAGSTLTHVIANMNLAGVTFASPASYTNPADYFAAYLGNYAAWGGTMDLYGDTFTGAGFAVTGLSISNGPAIPEPASWAALLGLGALGLVAWRRRGTRRAEAPH